MKGTGSFPCPSSCAGYSPCMPIPRANQLEPHASFKGARVQTYFNPGPVYAGIAVVGTLAIAMVILARRGR